MSAFNPTLLDFVNAQPSSAFGGGRADLIAFVNSFTETGRRFALSPGLAALVTMQAAPYDGNPTGALVFEITNQSTDPAVEQLEFTSLGGLAILSVIGGGCPPHPFFPLLQGLTIPATPRAS